MNNSYSHPRGYSSDFSDDFGGNEVDPWYTNSPDKLKQINSSSSSSSSSIINNNTATTTNSSYYNPLENTINYNGRFNVLDEDYNNEPPLLEEIGIRFDHIWDKTRAVIFIHQVCF